MSGVKTIELNESEARRSEEMRRRAEERERQRREEARKTVESAADYVSSLARGFTEKGQASLARIAADSADVARRRLSSNASTKEFQAVNASTRQEAAILTRSQALLSTVPESQVGVRDAMARSFEGARTAEELLPMLKSWEGQHKSFAEIERALGEANRALRFLNACRLANVPLDEVEAAATQLGEFIESPSVSGVSRSVRLASECTVPHLQQKLEMRRQDLLEALAILAAPLWTKRLAEWRSGLPEELLELRTFAVLGDWQALAEPLGEIDSFLKARAFHRLEVLEEGARAAGFDTANRRFDDREKAWIVDLHDRSGYFGPIVVGGGSWTRLPGESIRMTGPEELDASGCMFGGLKTMVERLRSQGAEIRVFSETHDELMPQGATSAKPGETRSAAGTRDTKSSSELS